MQFTKAQQSAIDAPAGTLLVSAGAGSGKTSVLTERIIKKICDESEPCNITDFLVVTFTKASAADLKNKISNAINKKLGESTEGTHLKRQQFLLGRANISTMDSFCKSLISANFEKLGMPAKFRIADPSEISIIKRAIFDDLLEKYHNSESEIYAAQSECSPKFSHGDFISTIENFIGAKDDENFYGVIEKLYDKVSSAIDGAALFSRELDMMRQLAALGEYAPFFGTEYGKAIRDLLLDDVAKAASELKTLNAKISAAKFEVLDKKYSPSFSNQIKFFAALSDILNEENLCRYDDAYELCAEYESVKVGSHRIDKEDTGSLEQKELLDKKNKSAKKFIGYIQTLFSHDFAETKRFAASYETALVVLGDFLDRFDAELTAEKQRQKSFEFSDLERLAFRLLVDKIDENGKIFVTELAEQLKGSYAEIYIDEYQDTNKIQDAIFRAISIENEAHENGNRFMVGDIKQSIYTFRGAKPGIFSAYSKLFEEDTDSPSKPKKIYLKTNFRSSRGIIDFINHIFSSLFSEKLGGVTYAGGEVLEFGKQEQGEAPCEKEPDVVFSLVEKIEAEDMEEAEETEKTEEAEEPDEPEENNEILVQVASAEAEYVALTIKNLLEHGRLKNGEKILPRHIVVLMRNYTKSELFMDALKKHEIPCYTDKSKGFLASAEIMLMVSLLKTIDNPMRDIELAATLKSPVFSFSLDELIYIKKFTEPMDKGVIDPARSRYKDPFYRYVCAYAAAGEMPPLKEKCESFLSKLELWRAKSRILPVDKFIWYLYRQTDMMAKISLESFAAEREANLMLLYEYARKFEETTFRGLYGFLGYLNDVQSGKDDFEKAKTTSEGGNAVRIMSVHKSKGLEFPVCILANTASPFNKSDYQRNPAIGDDGIYFDLKHSDNMGIEKPPFKKVFSERLKNEMQSEEARILYVALTRAIERLFVVGSVASLDKFLAKNTESADFSSLDSLLKWLAPILIDKEGKKKADIDFYVDLVYAGRLCELLAAADPTTASGPPP
ncbi:MAG: UvrD-helicase domain-containing protein, partial [Oscillospiraceae bacterium]|nr:UvrD-helicase domain-containing protein [Oscillospiraceae bacterium]